MMYLSSTPWSTPRSPTARLRRTTWTLLLPSTLAVPHVRLSLFTASPSSVPRYIARTMISRPSRRPSRLWTPPGLGLMSCLALFRSLRLGIIYIFWPVWLIFILFSYLLFRSAFFIYWRFYSLPIYVLILLQQGSNLVYPRLMEPDNATGNLCWFRSHG